MDLSTQYAHFTIEMCYRTSNISDKEAVFMSVPQETSVEHVPRALNKCYTPGTIKVSRDCRWIVKSHIVSALLAGCNCAGAWTFIKPPVHVLQRSPVEQT